MYLALLVYQLRVLGLRLMSLHLDISLSRRKRGNIFRRKGEYQCGKALMEFIIAL